MQSKESNLINAVVEGRRKDVSKLLDDGANVNYAENRSGLDTTPLYVAVCNNEIEIVNILFRHGADPNIPDKDGKTPLFMALYDDVDIKIFELLIDHGADVNFCNVSGENALLSLFKDCTTIGEGRCYTRISRLLELSKDVLSPNPEGKCPIHFIHVIHPSEEEQSSKNENHNCVDFLQRLLQRGASVNSKDLTKMTPLIYAASVCCDQAIDFLLENGAHPYDVNIYDESALHYLSENPSYEGFEESIDCLMKYGLDVNMEDGFGQSLLHQIMFSDKVQLNHVQYLLKKGMDFRKRDKMGSTVLHMIMSPPDDPIGNAEDDELESRDNEIIQIVKFLVNRGLNVNETNLQSLTPLHYAVQKGRKHLVEILLKLGADPTAKAKTGETSCHIASKDPEILEIILETHCSRIVNIQDNFGSTVFHWAIWYQDNGSFSLLLNRGFDPVVENSDGRNPIDYAKFLNYEYMLYQLITPYETYKSAGANASDLGVCLEAFGKRQNMPEEEPYTIIHVQHIHERMTDTKFENRECICKENIFGGCPFLNILKCCDNELNISEWKLHLQDHKDAFSKYAGLIRDSCDMGLYYNTDENHDIAISIENIMKSLAQNVKMTNPILECNVTLSGSRKEGTKIGQNDEFDIKWHLLKFSEHVEPIELPEFPKGFVKLKLKGGTNSELLQKFVDENDFIDSMKVIRSLYSAINLALLNNDVLTGTNLYLKSFLDLHKGSISNINFRWTGKSFKDLDISVDIVPVVEPTKWLPKTINLHNNLMNQLHLEPKYSVVFKTPASEVFRDWNILLRISTADVEADIIKSMTPSIRKGYILVKALHKSEYFPTVWDKDDDDEPSVEYLTTYMLKSCFLYELENYLDQYNSNEHSTVEPDGDSSTAWAYKITRRMLVCVENQSMPVFFIPEVNLLHTYTLNKIVNLHIYKAQCECLNEMARFAEELLNKLVI